MNRFVKAGLKIPHGPIHHDDRRAFIHADDAAKPAVQTEDIAGMKPERMLQGMPDDSHKLGLCWVVEMNSDVFHKTSCKWSGGMRAFME